MINMFIGLGLLVAFYALGRLAQLAWEALDAYMWCRRQQKPKPHYHSLAPGVRFPCTDKRCPESDEETS
jgi:hypothetical protein